MSAPGYKWECSYCTVINPSNVRICEICGHSAISNPKRAITPPKVCTTSLNSISKLSLNGNECEVCFDNTKEMMTIPNCCHRICYTCIKKHFSLSTSCNCPVCQYPKIKGIVTNDPKVEIYLNNLFEKLSLILDKDQMDTMRTKLNTKKLAGKSNFQRCVNCNNGFISINSTKLQFCTSCQIEFCYLCQVTNEMKNHNCETYKEKLLKLSPNDLFDIKNLIKCPTCQFHESLIGNGCLHVTCSECQEEYCSYCKVLFNRNKILGLNANHSAYCWSNLRDKNLSDLKQLCNSHELPFISYDTVCNIKYINDEEKMVTCNNDSISNIGICENHYKKYLAILYWYKYKQ